MTTKDAKSRERLISEYERELAYANHLKAEGNTEISAVVAGAELAKYRTTVPIDEYIKMWVDGLAALKAGADLNKYTF